MSKKDVLVSEDKTANKSVSKALLESCRKALYKVKDSFDDVSTDSFDDLEIGDKLDMADKINKIIGGLGKSIETLSILESKVEKEEASGDKRRGNTKSSMLEEENE